LTIYAQAIMIVKEQI